MGFAEPRQQTFEHPSSWTGAGPHDVGQGFAIEADYGGYVAGQLIVKDTSGGLIRLRAYFDLTIENGAIVAAEPAVIRYVHAAWLAATTATPPELSISAGEIVATFVGIVGADVHATVELEAVKT